MKTKGFTLVEIVLTVSLVGILFTVTAIILDRGVDSFASISERGSQTQDARYAMERMVRELLVVTAGPQGELNNLQPTQVSFTDDLGINSDFNWNGQTLYRGSNPLLEGVTQLTFTGFRSDNQITNSTPQTRRIRIELTSIPSGETAPLVLRTDVFLRGEDMYENFQ